MDKGKLNELSKVLLDSSIEVHKLMGPGLLDSVYEVCLLKELEIRNIRAEGQVPVALHYKGFELLKDFRIDILVEDEIIIEVKACDQLLPVHETQLISYLKLTNKKLGFLVNFKQKLLKEGFRRFANNF
ncbi:MAG: GxxExxY protein [Ignavibacteria bacterium]|nr:GxxExxY protein [Ignavibacteria bacterium]